MNPIIYVGLDNYNRLAFLNRQEDPVLNIVSEVMGVSLDQIKSKSRIQTYVTARCLICHFLREYTSLTLSAIGKVIGGRDHSTVIHQLDQFKNLYQYNYEFKLIADKINDRLSVYKNVA